jgi:hypothetical protein
MHIMLMPVGADDGVEDKVVLEYIAYVYPDGGEFVLFQSHIGTAEPGTFVDAPCGV